MNQASPRCLVDDPNGRLPLFMLVRALMGLDTMRKAYEHGIKGGYRFYSYGDASLLLPDR